METFQSHPLHPIVKVNVSLFSFHLFLVSTMIKVINWWLNDWSCFLVEFLHLASSLSANSLHHCFIHLPKRLLWSCHTLVHISLVASRFPQKKKDEFHSPTVIISITTNYYHLLKAYYVPGTVLKTFYTLCHLLHMTTHSRQEFSSFYKTNKQKMMLRGDH